MEMAKAITNLDDDPTLEVVNLGVLLRQANIPYHVRNMVEEWVENPEVPTPKPTIKVNGEWHWEPTESNKQKFSELLSIHDWLDAEQRQRALESVALQCNLIVDTLIERAKWIVRRNSGCYKNNRSNSLQDGRRRVIELEGMIDYMKLLLNAANVELPQGKSREINKLLSDAKTHVNVQ